MKSQKLFLAIILTCFGITTLQATNWFKRKKEAEKKEKIVVEKTEQKETEKAADHHLGETEKEIEASKEEAKK